MPPMVELATQTKMSHTGKYVSALSAHSHFCADGKLNDDFVQVHSCPLCSGHRPGPFTSCDLFEPRSAVVTIREN